MRQPRAEQRLLEATNTRVWRPACTVRVTLRQCPHCASRIRAEAVVCPTCSAALAGPLAAPTAPQPPYIPVPPPAVVLLPDQIHRTDAVQLAAAPCPMCERANPGDAAFCMQCGCKARDMPATEALKTAQFGGSGLMTAMCRRCQSRVLDGSRFCHVCGADMQFLVSATPQLATRSGVWR